MKSILNTLIVLLLVGCNATTSENSNSAEEQTKVETTSEVKPVNPCDLFSSAQLVATFDIKDAATIEMYPRDKYNTTKQCQFIWPEEAGSVKGSQLMIDITSRTEDMGATFSRMLQLDLEKGLSASEDGKMVNILPAKLEGFGENAYHWAQPNFQNTQRISFQIRNEYRVDIIFNCNEGMEVSQELIKNKIIQVGKTIYQKI